ncbi:hypothetical protein EVAR_58821_1 [Eumeta japonica]|uniref:Uncharacterized protein n=1 Tax=Eumeta variegata TaxID=151549 RepID=A0A4C1YI13_EUMVA|nr:hypothetical protein EVAR_58821_1 [Eumeta japonica]
MEVKGGTKSEIETRTETVEIEVEKWDRYHDGHMLKVDIIDSQPQRSHKCVVGLFTRNRISDKGELPMDIRKPWSLECCRHFNTHTTRLDRDESPLCREKHNFNMEVELMEGRDGGGRPT